MKLIKFTIALSFILFCPNSTFAFNISGEYKGFYQYYDKKQKNIVGHFSINIKQDGEKISGIIKEPRTKFGPNKPYLLSDFYGNINGNDSHFKINFIKIYRYDNHKVNYSGLYNSYQGEIQGEWNIGNYKGNFKISKIQPTPDLDTDPPTLLVIKPEVIDEKSGLRGIKRIKQNTIEIVGFAADNVKVASVIINGNAAYLSEPQINEKNIMQGKVTKFSTNIELKQDERAININAFDIHQNRKSLNIPINISNALTQSQERQDDLERNSIYQKKYAVVIGINDYNSWPPLEFAVSDALAIKKFLTKHGYEVISLMNKEANRKNILKTLGYELPNLCNTGDAVLVYFAGHGHTENLRDGGKEGYIVPVDAGTTDSFLSAISMRQLRSIAERIKSKHCLFIMDSCYSGLGFSRSAGISKTDNQYIQKISQFRAVQMITAGGMNEQVVEARSHGIFTHNLLISLEGAADFDKDGYITGSELGTHLRSVVTKRSRNRQTPNFGRFEGEGEYIFEVK